MRSLILAASVGLVGYFNVSRAEEVPAPDAGDHAVAIAPKMITVDLKLIKVSRKKMRELGVDFIIIDGQQSHKVEGELAVEQMSSGTRFGFVEALAKNRVAHTIAEPRIVTTSGREASVSVGSQSESSDAEASSKGDLGIELRVTPTLHGDGKVEMELFLKYTWQENDSDESATSNRVRHFSLDTGLIANPRESSVFSGLVLEDSDDNYILIVTPQVVESTAAALPRQTLSK